MIVVGAGLAGLYAAYRLKQRGIRVVGEAVAARQGWCEGTLESVEAVLST